MESPRTCPKCGVVLERGKGARAPTWVRPLRKSEKRELDRIGRIWCRRCAVKRFTHGLSTSGVVKLKDGTEFTTDTWYFNPVEYSKEELITARETSYHLWLMYHGYKRFYVFRYFFQEIFKKTLDRCKKQGKIMRFSDLLESENTERTSCKWDWTK